MWNGIWNTFWISIKQDSRREPHIKSKSKKSRCQIRKMKRIFSTWIHGTAGSQHHGEHSMDIYTDNANTLRLSTSPMMKICRRKLEGLNKVGFPIIPLACQSSHIKGWWRRQWDTISIKKPVGPSRPSGRELHEWSSEFHDVIPLLS